MIFQTKEIGEIVYVQGTPTPETNAKVIFGSSISTFAKVSQEFQDKIEYYKNTGYTISDINAEKYTFTATKIKA